MITETVSRLIDEFAKFPGIGKKSAERLAYHVLRISKSEANGLAEAIRAVKDTVKHCRSCCNLAESELCSICQDATRQQELLCVVEQPRDLMAIEQSGAYRGLYHVLMGRIAPLEGVGPDDLTIETLVRRVRSGGFAEVLLATNPTLEGDGTALYVSSRLADFNVRITRLARGITSGSVLEFANREVLSDAIVGRQTF
jgi:recombination protein RecR